MIAPPNIRIQDSLLGRRIKPDLARSLTIDDWLAALGSSRPKPNGGSMGYGGYMALCPAHDDKKPSLSLDLDADGKVVVKCFSGCDFKAIRAAAGLDNRTGANGRDRGHQKKPPKTYTTQEVYSQPVFEFKLPTGKIAYVQRHKRAYYRPIGSGKWVSDLKGVSPVPYNLLGLIEGVGRGETVYHVEGCKDVDTATGWGLTATTTGGTNTWRPEFRQHYAGADVIILPDNDPPGLEYAETVVADLANVARSIKVVELPGLGPGGDLTDFKEGGGTKEDLLAAVEAAPYWTSSGGNNSNGSKPISAAELLATEFEPTRWVVPDVLPEGVHLLVGKPKKGKSWLALGLCEAIAAGGVAFGIKRVEQGDTLYLALEDNKKRLKKRLRKVLGGRMAPERMNLTTQWPKINEGGTEKLDEWLTANPEARLVMIDTLAKVRNPTRGQNIYAEDYAALEPLLPLAARHGVAIVVVYHLRKMAASDPLDEISSSTGLTAGVDGFMILRRTPGSKGPTLYVDGRDIEEPTEYALHWNLNTATWTIEGEAEEVRMSKERADILLTLNRSPEPLTPKEVADMMPGAKHNNVKYLMWTMLQDDQLLKDDRGKYRPAIPTTPTNPTNSTNSTNSANRTNRDGVGVSGLVEDSEATNRTSPDTYAENEDWVSGVSGVSEDSDDEGEVFE